MTRAFVLVLTTTIRTGGQSRCGLYGDQLEEAIARAATSIKDPGCCGLASVTPRIARSRRGLCTAR
jgi:hypothetical protein